MSYSPQELKILRIRLGNISQTQFGEKLGCTQQQVARWEAGRKISKPYLQKIKQLQERLENNQAGRQTELKP